MWADEATRRKLPAFPDEAIVFNAGPHTELIRMRYADFENLVNPVVVRFAAHV